MIKGLYIHIPFCDQICTYCDFCKMVASDDTKRAYMKALIKEIEYYNDLLAHIETIYIGGGTPSSLDHPLMDAFLNVLDGLVDTKTLKEYTIEANPNDVNESWVQMIKKHHVTRVSLGVQTMDDTLLKFLGRTHHSDDVKEAVSLFKKYQMNVNLDFIYAIPNQTEEQLMIDLNAIQTLKPNHISYYSLILEEKTVLNYLLSKQKIKDFDEDLARDFGEKIDAFLSDLNYKKYEFSNYALSGFESKHNLIYWNLEEYLGVGLNASSQFNNSRMVNPCRISDYLDGIKDKSLTIHQLEDFNPKMETLLVGLRKIEGVSLEAYENRFKMSVFDRYPVLKKHLDHHLLEISNGYLRFTPNGLYLSNQVLMDLIE